MAGFSAEQRQELKELLDEQSRHLDTKLDEQTQSFDTKLDDQRSAIMLDMTSLVRAELGDIRERLDRLFEMATEDTLKLNEELISLKRRVAILEKKFA